MEDSSLQLLVQEAIEVLIALQKESHEDLSDAEYIAGWRSIYLVHTLKQDFHRKCRQHLLDPKASLSVDQPTQVLMDNLAQVEKQIRSCIEVRVSKSKLKPRVIRLTERLEFSEEERRGLVFILLHTSGIEGSKAYEEQTNVTNFMLFSGLEGMLKCDDVTGLFYLSMDNCIRYI